MNSGEMKPDMSANPAGTPNRPVSYPTNHVVGVLDTAEQAERACVALRGDGFADDDIHVVSGQAAADRLRDSSGRRGIANLAIRIADRLGLTDEEMELKDEYEHALRDGHFLLRVAAESDDRKARASQTLLDSGGRSVRHLGRFTLESFYRDG